MAGFFHGTVALAFPTNTAISVVNKLLDEDFRILDESVVAGVSEFVNIVGGAAKAKFTIPDGSDPVVLTLPMVIRGSDYKLNAPKNSIWLDVPFTIPLGIFNVRVTMEANLVG